MSAPEAVPESAAARVDVALGARSYPIEIGDGLLGRCGERLAAAGYGQPVLVVTDESVAPLFGEAVQASLAAHGLDGGRITMPTGEATKSFDHLRELCQSLLSRQVERKTPVLALGGGVLGDLAGFAAAVTLRGLPLIQAPTTLLAQVDSAVGGKTGINTPQGKNLVGAFYQPGRVLADTAALDSLPQRELRAGYAEIVKYALIDRPGFFAWLQEHGPGVIAGDRAARAYAVAESCRAKAAIVAADETEQSGRRALLNLGHTFAHAIEAEAGMRGDIRHGEAVAVGLYLAFAFSARRGLCPVADAAAVRGHLLSLGLPATLTELPAPLGGWRAERLVAHMQNDKKVSGGRCRFILATGIGAAYVADDVELAEVQAFLTDTAS